MFKVSSVGGVLIVAALLAPYQTVGADLTDAEQAESAKLAKTVPIADLHDHDNYAGSKGDQVGVAWAGLGAKRGGRSVWFPMKEMLGDKRIAWAGQGEFNKVFFSGGMEEMLNPDNPVLARLYKESEQDLKDGLIVGIGEIFINNRTSSAQKRMRRKGQVDAPIFKKFFNLVAKYDGFLAFHMQADEDSMEQLGNLLESNRKGRVVWNHCGSDTDADDVEELMDKHSNLFCELSFRYPPVNKNDSREIFYGDGIDSSWRELMEKHPDRFMVGTDAHNAKQFVGSIRTVRKGLLPNLKPDTARKIAYQNAQRLFKLKDNP